MSTSDDGGVHEPQQPQRSPAFVEGGFVKRACVGAAVGGLCGAMSSVVAFLISIFVAAKFIDPNFGWGLVVLVVAQVCVAAFRSRSWEGDVMGRRMARSVADSHVPGPLQGPGWRSSTEDQN